MCLFLFAHGYFIIILICTLIAASCSDVNKTKDVWDSYDPDNLKYAWITRDSTEVNRWICSLSDTTLSDTIFYSRVADLSNITHFVFGNADPSEDSYWQIPKDERDRFKQDVRIVYSLYSKSCLFMKFVDWEQTLTTFDKYPQNGVNITDDDIIKITEDFNRICDSLPNPSQSSLRPWINFIPCHTIQQSNLIHLHIFLLTVMSQMAFLKSENDQKKSNQYLEKHTFNEINLM